MACQVLVLVYEPPHPAVELSLSSTIEELLLVPVEVGSVNTGVAGLPTLPLSLWPPIIGGVLSSTMMVWLTVPLVLLHASTACQVLVLVYEPPHPAVELSLSSTIEELLHVSLEVGSVNTGVAGHSTVPLPPCPPIIGAVVSTLVLRWLTVPLVLPQPSTALQLRVVTKAHAFPEVVSPRFCSVAPLHVSDTVGAVNDGEAGHSTVLLLPCPPIVGG